MKIAVIGSGISGLSSAYYLSKKHKVDLFEKQDRFGGHSYTLDIKLNEKEKVAVDAGFMVFNKITYPNLINFFKENDIEIEKSDMSFSVSVKGTNIEYCGKGLNGIFSNRGNLLNLKFVKMFFEIINFYKRCEKLNSNNIEKITLGEYLTKIGKSKYFIDYHIIPMVSAIWSMPPFEASQMPLTFFLSFFKNHGLFKLIDLNGIPFQIEVKLMLIKYYLKLVVNILRIMKLIKLLEIITVLKFITDQKMSFLIMIKLYSLLMLMKV